MCRLASVNNWRPRKNSKFSCLRFHLTRNFSLEISAGSAKFQLINTICFWITMSTRKALLNGFSSRSQSPIPVLSPSTWWIFARSNPFIREVWKSVFIVGGRVRKVGDVVGPTFNTSRMVWFGEKIGNTLLYDSLTLLTGTILCSSVITILTLTATWSSLSTAWSTIR